MSTSQVPYFSALINSPPPAPSTCKNVNYYNSVYNIHNNYYNKINKNV